MTPKDRDATLESLFRWTRRLTGLQANDVMEARETLKEWGIEHVTRELLAPTVDAAAGARLLASAVDSLVSRGVDVRQVKRKFRTERNVWSTWAELRALAILLEFLPPELPLTLEAGRSRGAHADFRFDEPTWPRWPFGQNIEFKAIGLSDVEAAFCQRAMGLLDPVIPAEGFLHLHTSLDFGGLPQGMRFTGDQVDEMQRIAAESARELGWVPGLGGAEIVAHDVEPGYARRVRSRIQEAVRQLPQGEPSSIALFWSNGAPIDTIIQAVNWKELPTHIVSILVLGSGVVFRHHNIHSFAFMFGRDADETTPWRIQSAVDRQVATATRDVFEGSSGVRAMGVRGDGQDIIRRDGRRRILPFGLLFAPDPDEWAQWRTQSSPQHESKGMPEWFDRLFDR